MTALVPPPANAGDYAGRRTLNPGWRGWIENAADRRAKRCAKIIEHSKYTHERKKKSSRASIDGSSPTANITGNYSDL